MKNIVGGIPRGDNFFPRDKVIQKIYRRLDSGDNVYMAAPRRVGKTAIMYRLQDKPEIGYYFIYIITESIEDTESFFKELLRQLLKSDAFNKLIKISKKTGELFRKIKSVNLGELGFELNESDINYFEDFRNLLQKLETHDFKIILMVDEFPQTVENIFRKSGKDAAQNFLQANRVVRQEANKNILFIITGSIGLHTLAEKLNATKEINDLNTVDIKPLDRVEAKELTTSLLNSYDIPIEQGSIDYLLDKIQWFVPFYIQLAVQEIIDEYENTEQTINNKSVSEAFSRITNRRNNHFFEHYYSRLAKTFKDNEYTFALELLHELTQHDEFSISLVDKLAHRHNLDKIYPIILRTLTFDGYIYSRQKKDEIYYCFTSPILRNWWRKYVIDMHNSQD